MILFSSSFEGEISRLGMLSIMLDVVMERCSFVFVLFT
jgi:hypothetical protein